MHLFSVVNSVIRSYSNLFYRVAQKVRIPTLSLCKILRNIDGFTLKFTFRATTPMSCNVRAIVYYAAQKNIHYWHNTHHHCHCQWLPNTEWLDSRRWAWARDRWLWRERLRKVGDDDDAADWSGTRSVGESLFHKWNAAWRKEWVVILRVEWTAGWRRVTNVDDRVDQEGCTVIRLRR